MLFSLIGPKSGKLACETLETGQIVMIAALLLLSLIAEPEVEPPHAANALFQGLRTEGITIEGTKVTFPAPVLNDGLSAEAQRAALKGVAGSDGRLDDLLSDSVSAPFVLKVHDEKGGEGVIIRCADLWFVVRADLAALDPAEIARRASNARPVEVGNMRFESHWLGTEDLKSRGIEPGEREWFVHLTGRLLDRIHVEATDRTVASKSEESWVIAARTDPKFDHDQKAPNRWWLIDRGEKPGAVHRYPGGASYAKVSRLRLAPGALLVEAHFAFAEPRAWFDGAPILRSKFSLIAQDQIRRLRRELAEQRKAALQKGPSRG
jgi:hypothetical protein